MKKWTSFLSLSVLLTLFLTGCQTATDTAGEMESSFSESELVENTETDVIEKSEILEEVSKEITQDDTEEAGEEETTVEEETESYYQQFWDDLDYTVTVLDEHMDISDEVPASELSTLQCEYFEWDNEFAFFFAYVDDGRLYYLREINKGYLYYSGENSSIEILPEISNIRRIKTVNVGSGVDLKPLLITETGEVYLLDDVCPKYSDEMKLVRFTPLKDYQVEDILSFGGEWSFQLEVLLKDGSVIKLQSESWG